MILLYARNPVHIWGLSPGYMFINLGKETVFSKVLLFGQEVHLFIQDLLVFTVIDAAANNFILAAVIPILYSGYVIVSCMATIYCYVVYCIQMYVCDSVSVSADCVYH